MRKQRKKAIVAACAIASFVALLLIWLRINSPRKDLDTFLRELAAVEVGKTTIETWRGSLERVHLSSVRIDCAQQSCTSSWRTNNELLNTLRLAPLTTVQADVQFDGGIASEVSLWVEIKDAPDTKGTMSPGTGATIRERSDNLSCHKEYSSYVKDKGASHWAVVAMDGCVSASDRARALAIDSRCLITIGGCKSGQEIVPQVFGRNNTRG